MTIDEVMRAAPVIPVDIVPHVAPVRASRRSRALAFDQSVGRAGAARVDTSPSG